MSKKKNESPEPLIIQARTINQKHYLRLLDGNADIVISEGPAGTGKTYLAVLHAIREYRDGNTDRIIITRPNVDSGDPLGHLPGDINEKMAPWVMPILDVFHEVYTPLTVKQMIERRELMIEPFAFMRGRTFKKAIIIGDEMQNSTPDQMKMLLTRIGEGSRMIITGDNEQHDRGYGIPGLRHVLERLRNRPSPRIATMTFTHRDVIRHEVIKDVLALYD